MMRDFQKAFGDLKHDINRRMSQNSFTSLFEKRNNIQKGVPSSDSFEDISVDNVGQSISNSVCHSSDNESTLAVCLEPSNSPANNDDTLKAINSEKLCMDNNHTPEMGDLLVNDIGNVETVLSSTGDNTIETLHDFDIGVSLDNKAESNYEDKTSEIIEREINQNSPSVSENDTEIVTEDVNDPLADTTVKQTVFDIDIPTGICEDVDQTTTEEILNDVDENLNTNTDLTKEMDNEVAETINDENENVTKYSIIDVDLATEIREDFDSNVHQITTEDISDDENFNRDRDLIEEKERELMHTINEATEHVTSGVDTVDTTDNAQDQEDSDLTVSRVSETGKDYSDNVGIIQDGNDNANLEEITYTENVVKQPELTSMDMTDSRQSLHGLTWSETTEVIDSGILQHLPKKQIQFQEAMFEIISSEASFHRSLKILTSHFMEADMFKSPDHKDSVSSPLYKIPENKDNFTQAFFKSQGSKEVSISSIERHHIFSNISILLTTSQNFLNDLEKRWSEQKPVLQEICDILLIHVSGIDFENFIKYLKNQDYQNKALERLSENDEFRKQLSKLENSPICGKLPIKSYLMQPMTRLTKLRLLVEAILKLMFCEDLRDSIPEDHIDRAEMALVKLKALLNASESEKGELEQKNNLLLMMNRLDFPTTIKSMTFSNKRLIREAEFKVHQQNPLRQVRKFTKKRQPTISLILFNDVLIVAKKKGTRMLVIDYCDLINIKATLTRYKSIGSSLEMSDNVCSVDIDDETEYARKDSFFSLDARKTSITSVDNKRFSSGLANSLKYLPLILRNDEQEIINYSFSLQFIKGQTDIFSIAMVLVAATSADRDEWMALLAKHGTVETKVHKTTSLKQSSNRNDNHIANKRSSLYHKRTDDLFQLSK